MSKRILLLFVIVFFVLFVYVNFSSWEGKLSVHFFDIGVGDAIYIRTPQKHDIVIDAGPSQNILSKLGDVMPFYDRTLDIVIITHPHADHITGTLFLLENYTVKQVYLTGAMHTTYEYQELLKTLRDSPSIKKIKVDHPFSVRVENDVDLMFLYPDFDAAAVDAHKRTPFIKENLNNTSIVVKLISRDQSFLFMGDLEKEGESYLLQRYQSDKTVLDADVLKVGHQGSKTSSTEEFLKAVSPTTAVITVSANNPYHHPHQEVVERLHQLVPEVLRTDKDGDIIIEYED